jgi:hypothetical protein
MMTRSQLSWTGKEEARRTIEKSATNRPKTDTPLLRNQQMCLQMEVMAGFVSHARRSSMGIPGV